MDINTFIIEKKSEYFAVCNKILDFYYDALDNKKVLKGLGDKEVLHINGLIEETELIRSKIRDNISLNKKEINSLLLSATYVEKSLLTTGNQYVAAADELEKLNMELQKLILKNLTNDDNSDIINI